MGRIRWGRLLRRGLAVCLAAVALWCLCLGSGTSVAAGMEKLGSSPAFVTAALRTELGYADSSLPFWQRLAVEQSPLLEANPGRDGEEEPPSEEDLPDAQPAPDHDDVTEDLPEETAAPENIIPRTLAPNSSEGYVTGGGLYLYNRTDGEVDLAGAASAEIGFALAPASEGPQILIVHSHATEAYTPDGTDTYVPSDNSRTLNEEQNMLRVGDEMERVFTEMGLSVLHDRALHDYPHYDGAYTRSRAAVEEYLAQYPTIKLVLDVHRDALIDSDGTVYKVVTDVDGAKTAQVMLVVGRGRSESHPGWEENLALAAKIQKNLDALYPTLARPITLRQSVYNQDLCPGSLLVEVGSHGCTLQEALAGARAFARCAGAVYLALVEH